MNTPAPDIHIELIYDADCPNVTQAREVLARALKQLQLDCRWQEWERRDAACPAYARHLGSPSILVNTRDVSQSSHNESACCRIYPENPEFKGCPGVDEVIAALENVI